MEFPSEDPIRLSIRAKKTGNERAVERLQEMLQKELEMKEKRMYETFNKDMCSLAILTNLYPNVPITPVRPFGSTIQETMYGPLQNDVNLRITSPTTFGIERNGVIFEYTYNAAVNNLVLLRRREDIVGVPHYFGKLVVVAPEEEEYNETDEVITLAPCPARYHEEDYVSNLYRDRDGIVKSHIHWNYDENDAFESIYHFGGVAWKLKERIEDSFTNLIFENLRTREVRRHIVKASSSDYFMLENEIFCSMDVRSHKGTPIMRCSTGEVFHQTYNNTFYIDCTTYAVTLKRLLNETFITILRTIPPPPAEEPVDAPLA